MLLATKIVYLSQSFIVVVNLLEVLKIFKIGHYNTSRLVTLSSRVRTTIRDGPYKFNLGVIDHVRLLAISHIQYTH